jgi:hypothetical protein
VVLGLAISRVSLASVPIATATTVLVQRDLRFADAPDGGIIVTDATANTQAARLEPGTNGFREGPCEPSRARAACGDRPGSAVPARALPTAGSSCDPATSQHVTISSFGPRRSSSFDRLLPP